MNSPAGEKLVFIVVLIYSLIKDMVIDKHGIKEKLFEEQSDQIHQRSPPVRNPLVSVYINFTNHQINQRAAANCKHIRKASYF